MTRIPPEIIKVSIKPGSVYYLREDTFKSTEKHYFVVINRDPRSDEVILLVCASSRISHVKLLYKHCSKETLVIVTPEEYNGFRIPSIFNCNSIFIKDIKTIMKKYKDNELLIKPEMDIKLVDTLRKGVLASNQILEYVKEMLRT